MQYMRAHGNTPGPTQRPATAGAVSGLVAGLPAAVVLSTSGALNNVAQALKIEAWLALLFYLIAMILVGGLYGKTFRRAANDRRGGWLFGISYGFLVWLLGPVTALQLIKGEPLAIGVAAIGLFGTHLTFGLALGLLFPWIHKLLQRELGDLEWKAPKASMRSVNPRVNDEEVRKLPITETHYPNKR